jgi:hypothetical protein
MSSKFHVPGDGLVHLLDFDFIKYSNKKYRSMQVLENFNMEKYFKGISTFQFYVYLVFARWSSL